MHAWLRVALVYTVGIGLILFGIAGLVLPLHPGLVVIALGVGVLSLESETARRARVAFLNWLADRDVDAQRLQRWQQRLEDWLPEDETAAEDGDGREDEGGDGEPRDRGR
jgi:Flp pilus assembly protein TadB